ncbi:MAG: hypothetical protein Q8Q91_00430, partial [Candidatus Daviesbacteria bacterium]|nr:hypothetical protein [Candidatus Daviesbacteria bacterium]
LIYTKTPTSEEKSKYLLVLTGFFYDRLAPRFFQSNYKQEIKDGFKQNNELKTLSNHVEDWQSILKEISRKKMLNDNGRLLLVEKV